MRERGRAHVRGHMDGRTSSSRTRVSNAFARRPLYVVKVGPCSCREAATLVGYIIPLSRDTTTLPLCSSTLPACLPACLTAALLSPHVVNKDEWSERENARAHFLPEASSLNSIDS